MALPKRIIPAVEIDQEVFSLLVRKEMTIDGEPSVTITAGVRSPALPDGPGNAIYHTLLLSRLASSSITVGAKTVPVSLLIDAIVELAEVVTITAQGDPA